MKKIMQEKYQVIPDSDLSPEFLSQFKKEADVSKTIKHKTPKLKLKFKLKLKLKITTQTPNFQASSF